MPVAKTIYILPNLLALVPLSLRLHFPSQRPENTGLIKYVCLKKPEKLAENPKRNPHPWAGSILPFIVSIFYFVPSWIYIKCLKHPQNPSALIFICLPSGSDNVIVGSSKRRLYTNWFVSKFILLILINEQYKSVQEPCDKSQSQHLSNYLIIVRVDPGHLATNSN